METLIKLRKQKGVYQKDVAKAVGVSRAVYSTYELGKAEPSISTLCDLAEYFGTTVDELVGRTSTPPLYAEACSTRCQIQILLDQLSELQQAKVLGYIDSLLTNK